MDTKKRTAVCNGLTWVARALAKGNAAQAVPALRRCASVLGTMRLSTDSIGDGDGLTGILIEELIKEIVGKFVRRVMPMLDILLGGEIGEPPHGAKWYLDLLREVETARRDALNSVGLQEVTPQRTLQLAFNLRRVDYKAMREVPVRFRVRKSGAPLDPEQTRIVRDILYFQQIILMFAGYIRHGQTLEGADLSAVTATLEAIRTGA